MTIEQIKAAIAALSTTPEEAEDNSAVIERYEAMLVEAEGSTNKGDIKGESDDNDPDAGNDPATTDALTPDQQKIVDRELKKMKDNMNKMSSKLKAQAAAQAQAEADAKAAEITRLKEDGKVQEALELELEAAMAKNAVLSEANTKLTRDGTLETVLSALDFRNSRSRSMAKKDLTDQLIQVDGAWQHKDGSSIADAVEAYAADTENKFLFKTKTNSGGGTTTTNNSSGNPDLSSKPASMFDMTTEQMLKHVAKNAR